MSVKINGQDQPVPLGDTASESVTWGDIIAVGRACDRFLRARGLVCEWNGARRTREELKVRAGRLPSPDGLAARAPRRRSER